MQSFVGRFLGFVAAAAVVLALASPALAGDHDRRPPKPPKTHKAPEIDPAGLGAMASLLAGGTLLLKARRNGRPQPQAK